VMRYPWRVRVSFQFIAALLIIIINKEYTANPTAAQERAKG